MKRTELLGVWRLLGVMSRGRAVLTGKTHLVVQENELWEVWPKSTYYEGEPGPECEYRFEDGTPGRLEVVVPHGKFCYLVQRDGDSLRMRLGGVFGQFPASIDDELGNLSTFERVTGDEAAEYSEPRPRVSRETVSHPRLGVLTYDDNFDWWRTTITFGGQEIGLDVTVGRDAERGAALDAAASIVDRLDRAVLEAYAASRLLELHNDSWRDEDDDGEEGPPIDAATFASRLTPKSLTIEADGSATLWFEDGRLFAGHSVYVAVDSEQRPKDASIAG